MTDLIIKKENAVVNPTRESFPILEIVHYAKNLTIKDYSEKSLIELNLNELSADVADGFKGNRLTRPTISLVIAGIG